MRFAVAILHVCQVGAFAQVLVSITGRVTGPDGRPIPSAVVSLTDSTVGFSREAKPNEGGQFIFAAIPAGSYSLAVNAPGFAPLEVERIELNVAGALQLNLKLDAKKATFRADSGTVPILVEKDRTGASTVVRREFVENLPLNGRSFQSLIELAPGVVLTKADTVSGGPFSVNGQRSNANYFLVDGVGGNVAASTAATFSQQAAGTLPGLTVLSGTNSLATLDSLQEFVSRLRPTARNMGDLPVDKLRS